MHSLSAAMLALFCALSDSPLLTAQQIHTSRPEARILPLPKGDDVFHFVVYGDRTGGPADGVKVLRQAVQDTNLLDPDLVLTVGDLIQGYNRKPQWMKDMREFRGIMDGLRCPWFPVAGNHDIYWRGPGRPEGEHEKSYEKHFGPLWYWFEHKDCAFFVLYTDEGDPKDGSKGFRQARHTQMSPEQLGWLRKELAKLKDKRHVFCFCHHPRWIDGRYRGSNWNAVHAVLRDAGNVRAVFGGHIHRTHYKKRDGIEYITLATTGGHLSADLPQAGYLHHYNVVTVRKDRISHATYPVGAVIDPRRFTQDFTQAIDRLRSMRARVTQRANVASDGNGFGIYAFELRNPSTRAIEVVAMLEGEEGSKWRFGPRHRHTKIAPGETAKLQFAYAHNGSLSELKDAVLSLQCDLLAENARITLPARRMPMSWSLDVDAKTLPAPRGDHALELSSGRAHVAIDSQAFALPDGPFTVECWCKPSQEIRGRCALVSKAESSEYGIFCSDGKLTWSVHLNGRYVNVASEDVADKLRVGKWQHVAGVFDGRELRLYLDGRLLARADGTGARTRNAYPLILGGDTGRNGANSFFRGSLDTVRISRYARYTAEKDQNKSTSRSDERDVLRHDFDHELGRWSVDSSDSKAHARLRNGARLVRRTY